jgi:hypothetical protein
MKRLLYAVAVALAGLAATAAPSPAGAPNGNGLTYIPASPIGLHCEDGGTYSVLVTRNLGKSGWQVEASQHYVVGTFSITEYELGVVSFSESGTWGVRAGLEPLECWAGFIDANGSGYAIASTIFPVPPTKD